VRGGNFVEDFGRRYGFKPGYSWPARKGELVERAGVAAEKITQRGFPQLRHRPSRGLPTPNVHVQAKDQVRLAATKLVNHRQCYCISDISDSWQHAQSANGWVSADKEARRRDHFLFFLAGQPDPLLRGRSFLDLFLGVLKVYCRTRVADFDPRLGAFSGLWDPGSCQTTACFFDIFPGGGRGLWRSGRSRV